MKNCDNELRIFDYIEDDLSKEDKSELAEHLRLCANCQKLYDEYSAIKENTNNFYSSIDFNQKPVELYKVKQTGQIFKRTSIAFSIAASIVLGFLMISNNHDQGPDFAVKSDSIYQTVDEPVTTLNQSEWNLKLNLLQHKIELIKDEMRQ
jgi:hypothetical protein